VRARARRLGEEGHAPMRDEISHARRASGRGSWNALGRYANGEHGRREPRVLVSSADRVRDAEGLDDGRNPPRNVPATLTTSRPRDPRSAPRPPRAGITFAMS
jgi:hypothetical protein